MMSDMLTMTARCPYCQETFRTLLSADAPVVCAHCQKELQPFCPDWLLHESHDPAGNPDPMIADLSSTTDTTTSSGSVHCLTCPSTELFVRKDFPQQLGVAIVVIGFAASSIAWYFHQIIATYAILFGTALIDVVLYLVMGNVLECYRCHAQYRGLRSLDNHESFNLETHERYRQQAARLQEAALAASQAATKGSATAVTSESPHP